MQAPPRAAISSELLNSRQTCNCLQLTTCQLMIMFRCKDCQVSVPQSSYGDLQKTFHDSSKCGRLSLSKLKMATVVAVVALLNAHMNRIPTCCSNL